VATLTANLKHVTAKFGERRIDRLPVSELKAWPKRLSPGSRRHVVKAFRQVLNSALERGYVVENAAARSTTGSRSVPRSGSSPRRKSTAAAPPSSVHRYRSSPLAPGYPRRNG
jgi:hypothetical protein